MTFSEVQVLSHYVILLILQKIFLLHFIQSHPKEKDNSNKKLTILLLYIMLYESPKIGSRELCCSRSGQVLKVSEVGGQPKLDGLRFNGNSRRFQRSRPPADITFQHPPINIIGWSCSTFRPVDEVAMRSRHNQLNAKQQFLSVFFLFCVIFFRRTRQCRSSLALLFHRAPTRRDESDINHGEIIKQLNRNQQIDSLRQKKINLNLSFSLCFYHWIAIAGEV